MNGTRLWNKTLLLRIIKYQAICWPMLTSKNVNDTATYRLSWLTLNDTTNIHIATKREWFNIMSNMAYNVTYHHVSYGIIRLPWANWIIAATSQEGYLWILQFLFSFNGANLKSLCLWISVAEFNNVPNCPKSVNHAQRLGTKHFTSALLFIAANW